MIFFSTAWIYFQEERNLWTSIPYLYFQFNRALQLKIKQIACFKHKRLSISDIRSRESKWDLQAQYSGTSSIRPPVIRLFPLSDHVLLNNKLVLYHTKKYLYSSISPPPLYDHFFLRYWRGFIPEVLLYPPCKIGMTLIKIIILPNAPLHE